ncbi:MAG TPA: hypothetical protein VF904_08025 [Anaeromyxobacteraceae bacterium]
MATNGSKDVMAGARDTVREVQGRMAGGMEDLRGYAETADTTIREFARERPMVAIACAVGLGFLIGRLASRA